MAIDLGGLFGQATDFYLEKERIKAAAAQPEQAASYQQVLPQQYVGTGADAGAVNMSKGDVVTVAGLGMNKSVLMATAILLVGLAAVRVVR